MSKYADCGLYDRRVLIVDWPVLHLFIRSSLGHTGGKSESMMISKVPYFPRKSLLNAADAYKGQGPNYLSARQHVFTQLIGKWPHVVSMLDLRRRRWANLDTT